MAKFEPTDDSVVVIIGSGAGGGTLANELCQKGIKVVVLEAGGHQSPATFINDEWKSFVQLAWLDPRTTSGNWRVAKDLDATASDAATAKMLREGVAGLDKAVGGPGSFAKASDAKRLAAVKAIEGSPFFGAVRGKCITSLYDNDMAYVAFGYPGASWDKGGYITRGFQDLKWLPAPDLKASPKPFMG